MVGSQRLDHHGDLEQIAEELDCRSERARLAESYAPFSIASSSGSVGEINSAGKVKARLSKLRPHIAAMAATMITSNRSNADVDAHCSGSVTTT